MDVDKKLEVFNKIHFVESEHRYFIDNEPAHELSVTRLIKRFKREFQKEAMAKRVANKLGVSVQQVLADWEMNGLYSTTIGTMFHRYVESFYKKQKIESNLSDFEKLGFDERTKIKENLPIMVKYFQNFYNRHPEYKCVKNEFVVGDLEDTKICGTADMLCLNPKGNLEIFDFKTNKKINTTSKYAKLFYPFDDMDECEFNEYTIQLNVYKYFIEKYTDLKVDGLKLVWIQPTNDNFELIELPSIQDKIKLMLERFKATSLFEEQAA